MHQPIYKPVAGIPSAALAKVNITQQPNGELKIVHNCTPFAFIGLLSQIINQVAMQEFMKQQMIIDPNGPPKPPTEPVQIDQSEPESGNGKAS